MAGNNQVFDAAMRRGQDFASNKEWDKAMREYMRAASEFPNDVNMRSALAETLLSMGQKEKALEVYEGLTKYNPKNTNALNRSGEIYTTLGNQAEAIKIYYRLKDIYLYNNQPNRVIETLKQIINIEPSRSEAYREIINTAKARGDRKTAAATALSYAVYSRSNGQNSEALSFAEEALMLQPDYAEAVELKRELNSLQLAGVGSNISGSKPALTSLEDAREDNISKLLSEAEEALQRGESGKALRQYELALEAGAKSTEIFYTTGRLYAQAKNYTMADKYLRLTAEDTDYAASAYFALGQMLDEAGETEKAVRVYEDAINQIDLQQIGQDEIDELISMYEPLAENYQKLGNEEQATHLYGRLRDLIQGKKLRTEKTAVVLAKLREYEGQSEELAEEVERGTASTSKLRLGGGNTETSELAKAVLQAGLTAHDPLQIETKGTSFSGGQVKSFNNELLGDTPSNPVIFPFKLVEMEGNHTAYPYVRAAEEFIKKDLILAAIDSCHELIRYYPDYLPSQVILAEIYQLQNKLEQARSKYQYVVDLYQMRNEPLKAIEVYRRLADLSPDNLALRTKLANLMLQAGMSEDAAEISLGTIQNYVRSGQTERALEECRKLRNQAPQSALIRLEYGELLNRLERYSEALPEFRRALEIEPSNLRAVCLLNITLFLNQEKEVRWTSFRTVIQRSREKTENLKQALEVYREAALLHDRAALHYTAGCLYIEAKQPPVATLSFEQAVRKAVQEGEASSRLKEEQAEYELLARYQLALIYQSFNRHDAAIAEFSKVVNLQDKADPQNFGSPEDEYGGLPSQAQIYRKLGQAFSVSGKIDYAIKSLRTVKKLVPYDRAVHFELADLNFQQGNLNEALMELGELASHFEQLNKTEDMVEVLKQMVRLAPSKIEVHDKLSQVYLQRGLIPDGLRELDELAELLRKNGRLKDAVRSLQKAAEINWMMGEQAKSYGLYDRIVRISPGDVEARQQLVNLHIMSGRLKDAANEQRAIAQICLQGNQTQEAIAALHQVIMLAPEDTRAYFQLATVLTSAGEYSQAFKLYSRILRLEPANDKAQRLREQVQQRGIQSGQIKPEKVV